MAAAVEFRYHRAGELTESVSVDDDGSVLRTVHEPADPTSPAVGTWTGTLDGDGVDVVRRLAGEDWSAVGTQARPPGVGGWMAAKADAQVGLWSVDGLDEAGAQLVGRLSALLAWCLDAVSAPRAVLLMTAWWGALGDERLAMVHLENLGSETVVLRADDDPNAPPAAFMDDDAEVVGFLGGDVELAAGRSATALVRDRGTSDGRVRLSGSLRGGPVAAVPVRMDIPIADG